MFLVGLICVAVPYFASNNIANIISVHGLGSRDSTRQDIPVINWMIIPYAAPVLVLSSNSVLCPKDDRVRLELLLAMQRLILVTIFCVVIFLVLPAEIDLRWQLDEHWVDHPLNGIEQHCTDSSTSQIIPGMHGLVCTLCTPTCWLG